jgi:drug/metabolite transporter (DMT)-like permease
VQRLKTWQLFAICVLTWGTTWYAITFQVGRLSPEVGVALRFAIAGLVVLAIGLARGDRLRFGAAEHRLLALQGCFMYGVSYLCVYHAEKHLVSGIVAVGYSASPLVTGLGAHWLFGTRISRRFLAGGLLGLAGVTLLFWPEFGKATGGYETALGAVFTIGSVLLSAVGSLTASRNRANGLPLWPAMGYGMLYGAAVSALVALLQGQSFVPPIAAAWWISLLYLALAGSVLTFACFLTLQDRIGPGPTGTVGVMTPLLAILVSMLFEGFRPDVLTLTGAVLAVAGNSLMLRSAMAAGPVRR